jgi:hypothetical protein
VFLTIVAIPTVAKAQYFETSRTINQKEVPAVAFLYRLPDYVIRQAAQNIFAQYDISSFSDGMREYFTFPGESLGSILLNRTYVKYWVECVGEEKSVLYLSLFMSRTELYAPNLKHTTVQQKIKERLIAVEEEAVNIFNRMFLTEQDLKVVRLANELRELLSELQQLETHEPNAVIEINRLRATVRAKRMELGQETDILNRLKDLVGL